MARKGSRHRLVVYTKVIDRLLWFTLAIGMVLIALTLGQYYLPATPAGVILDDVTIWVAGSAGVYALILAVFLILIRMSAYIQPFENHLRLVTPFLRLKIAYRRIRQTSSVEMPHLFPLSRHKRQQAILRSVARYMAVVLDLNGLPLSRTALRLFLSPLFFPDQTARMAFVVPDWMKFSTELENFRSAWQDTQRQADDDPRGALLSSINKSRR
jgi:hypothetical protein